MIGWLNRGEAGVRAIKGTDLIRVRLDSCSVFRGKGKLKLKKTTNHFHPKWRPKGGMAPFSPLYVVNSHCASTDDIT